MESTSKILVTGGAGFIGSHTVVELILAGYDVVIVDNLSRSEEMMLEGIKSIVGKHIPFYKIDCLDQVSLDKVFTENSFTAVIHFAAYKSVNESVEKPLEYHRNNVESLITLLQVMEKYEVKDIIFSSSCTVYGQP